MVVQKKTFFTEQTTAQESDFILNITGSKLVVEVTGTATAISATIEGMVGDYNEDDWTALAFIDRSTGSVVDEITETGIFACDIDGIVKARINLATVTGGNVSVIGKICQ